jgi:hypothetical protein
VDPNFQRPRVHQIKKVTNNTEFFLTTSTNMTKSSFSKVIAVFLTLLQFSSALHFYLNTGQTRCFFEELQDHVLVVGKIDAYEKDATKDEYIKNRDLGVRITVEVS